MPYIGYIEFTGNGPKFTVPVFENDTFIHPSEFPDGINVTLLGSPHTGAVWNSVEDIINTREVISGGESSADSSPIITFVTVGDKSIRVNLGGGIVGTYPAKDSLGGLVYPCIFYFPAMGERYYLSFSDSSLAPEKDGLTFFFTYASVGYYMNRVNVVQDPIKLTGEAVPEPDYIIIKPSPAYAGVESVESTKQFTATYVYDDGSEIQMDSTNGVWSVEDVGDSGITIDQNGLVTIPPNPTIGSFYVKATWQGSEYNKSVTALVRFIADGNGNPYNPSIGTGAGGTGGFPSWTGGGGGNFGIINGIPEASDSIAPSLPPTGSYEGSLSNAGLFVHYAMNGNMLEVVGDWLWATDLGLLIAKEVLSILYGSPIESAISLMSYPFNVTALPGVVSNQQELYWGAHGAGFNATAITNPYATIDWGTVQLTEFWGNFLDYAPHTKLELYLPWCTGFVPIDPNECLPGSLRVVTNIELAKGTCLHNVIGNDGRVIATHSGTCGKQLPLTALDTSGKALALVSGAVAAGVTVAGATTGAAMGALDRGTTPVTYSNLAAPANVRYGLMRNPIDFGNIASEASAGANKMRRGTAPAIGAAAASFRNPISVQRSGTFSGSSAGLGVQYPYLILSRPTQSVPAQYGHHYGYPSNIYAPLGNIHGYTEVGEIHLSGFTCTDDELSEIDSILKSGVIL